MGAAIPAVVSAGVGLAGQIMGGQESSAERSARKTAESGANTAAANAAMARRLGLELADLSRSGDVRALAGQALTPAEQAQLDVLNLGNLQQQQTIEQRTREGATARGLFSSRGAITQEALNLAELDKQRAMQRAGILAGAQDRQFQGLQLRGGLLGNTIGGITGAGSLGIQLAGVGSQQQAFQNMLSQQRGQQASQLGQQVAQQFFS